jgi:predicted GNAT family N-acyltransferase
VPESEELDETDALATHFLILSDDPTDFASVHSPPTFVEADGLRADSSGLSAIATLRTFPHGQDDPASVFQLGRFAVVREGRGRGIGSMLLELAEEYLVKVVGRGTTFSIALHAQLDKKDFYVKNGYRADPAHAEIFLDAGIEHTALRKQFQ